MKKVYGDGPHWYAVMSAKEICENKKRKLHTVLVWCSAEHLWRLEERRSGQEKRASKLKRRMFEVLGLAENLSPRKGWTWWTTCAAVATVSEYQSLQGFRLTVMITTESH